MKALDLIRALQATGADASAVLKAVATVLEADDELRRNKDAERQRRHRASRLSRDVTVTNVSPRDIAPIIKLARAGAQVRADDSSSSSVDTGKIERKNNTPSPREELETVLDAEHAAAVIEHRQRKRCSLTARAAKMLAKQFAKASDPNAAADTMLARGWTGFEPEWLEPRDGKANGKTDGPVLYKFSTAEEFLADLEHQRKNHVG